MVQPKYSPEEALQRIKLMMEYDSSRTYTENKVIVENKQPINEIAPLVVGGIAAGVALVGAGIGAWREWQSADTEEKIKMLFQSCDKPAAADFRSTMTDPEIAQLTGIFRKAFNYQILGFAGGTDLDLIQEALNVLETKGNVGDFCKVRKVYGAGSAFETMLIEELGDAELGWVITTFDVLGAKSGAGSIPARNQESAQSIWWQDTFPCVETRGSFVYPMNIETNPNNGFTSVKVQFKVNGVLKQFKLLFNGRIYTLDDKYTGKKVVCSGTNVTVVAESVKKKTILEQADLGNIDLSPIDSDLSGTTPAPSPDPGTTPPVRTSGYRSCSGSYSFGCKTDPTGPIGVVQGCLGGLVVDGKFGPRTKDALKAKGYESFTDAEVDKICGIDAIEDTDVQDIEGLRANQL
jgi:hypothetical protein